MDRLKLIDGDDALNELRGELRLLERVPVIEEFHIAGMVMDEKNGPVALLCCHDEANGGKHLVPVATESMSDPGATLANLNLVLAAAWN